MKKHFIAGLAAVTLLVACDNKSKSTSTETSSEFASNIGWKSTASIYEVNIRQHTPEGTIAAFTQDLDRISRMGVGILWIMPVQPIGMQGRKDPKDNGKSLGSYYSISDYTAVNPEFGTEADFKAMVDKAHKLGMKVILDWVANHTAFDHHWASEHPEFYNHDENGDISVARNNDGTLTDWTDVADLNYDEPGLHKAMVKEMSWWISQFDIDGFRCDVAGYVPHEFWQSAIPQLHDVKDDIFMLAEWDEPYLHDVFDMTYGWDFHHRTNEVAKGKAYATTFDDYKRLLDTAYPADAMKMLFTTNHDENSWNGTVYERYGDGHKAFFVLCATYEHGMPLIYSGQEAGLDHRLEFFYKDTVTWKNPNLEAFYAIAIKTKTANPALWNAPDGGEQEIITTTNDANVYAFTRKKGDNTVIVFINLSNVPTSFTYNGNIETNTYEEVFTGNLLNLESTGAMDLGPYEYMVFSSQITGVE
ncbi:MAG: alpha-amylase [Bacteroidetes bacterium]|nr:MAG: alpha-amylase [Bacteroidota bacterium]